MKSIWILFTVILLGTFSCTSWVQVMDTETVSISVDKLPEQGYSYAFQNDSIAIVYTLWAKKGVLAFSIYNKLDIPIYIDWKKSSYISKGDKLNYWTDEKTVNGTSITTGYAYSGGSLFVPNIFGTTVTNQRITTPERITFIPPKSTYYRSDFLITPKNWYDVNKLEKTTIPSPSKPGENIEAKVVNLTFEESPFKFRNFLTWSTKESFDNEYYVNHEFFVSKVTMVKSKDFSNDTYSNTNNVDYYYKRNDRFYVFPTFKDI